MKPDPSPEARASELPCDPSRDPSRERNRDLSRTLRAGDPLAGDAAAVDEERALARVATRLAAHEPHRNVRPSRSLTWATAALVALVAVGWIAARFDDRGLPDGPRAAARTVAGASPVAARDEAPALRGASTSPAEPEARQVQFATAGGTRVIWVLDPRFSL